MSLMGPCVYFKVDSLRLKRDFLLKFLFGYMFVYYPQVGSTVTFCLVF